MNKPEQHRSVIIWLPDPRGGGAGEAEARLITLVDERIDDADEAVFTDPVSLADPGKAPTGRDQHPR